MAMHNESIYDKIFAEVQMKKVFFVLSLLFVLCGCAKNTNSIQVNLDQKIEAAMNLPADEPRYNHVYYRYYAEPSIGRIAGNITSNIFAYNGIRFIMNLNVPAIINRNYYTDHEMDFEGLKGLDPMAQTIGTYTDYTGHEHPYEVKLYQLKEEGITLFTSDYVDFYAVNVLADSPDLAYAMMRIARSVSYDEALILNDFSNVEKISNTRKKLELFQNIAPESGVIEELFMNENSYLGEQNGLYNSPGDEHGDEDEEQAQEEPTDEGETIE